MKMEQTECSETSAYTIQTPGNRQKERIQQDIFFHKAFLNSHSSRRPVMYNAHKFIQLTSTLKKNLKEISSRAVIPSVGINL
jgi:hypothetical protein